jgi:two-component system, LytTR family, sensor kinase
LACRLAAAQTIGCVVSKKRDRPIESLLTDRKGAFWFLQLGGWLAYFLLRLLPARVVGEPATLLRPAVVATATGFCLTLILASVFRRVIARTSWQQWIAGIVALIVSAFIFSYLEVWSHVAFVEPDWQPKIWEYLALAFIDFYVLTAWSGAYFGISYYLMSQQQQQRMLELTAEAHGAQLKMLRYQLNPHFLFNTLNSISTLVLVKDAVRANAMLERLSKFLRATLAEDPGQTVSIAQDMETLQLYLDIERMRFQDRLRVICEVDPGAASTRVPALLLQPLVENAIKYAVAPSEDGATITVRAERIGQRIRLTVADTGPGMPTSALMQRGVGIANTRERLTQLYGDDQRMLISSNDPHGVVIAIDLPALVTAFLPHSHNSKEVAA